MPDEFFLDPRVVQRSFDAVARTFDASAVVHAEIRARLLERLDVVRMTPDVVLDLGAGTGHASRALQARYRSAHIVAMDLSSQMLLQARHQQRLLRRFTRIAGDAHRLPLRAASVDLIFSNLMLQWCSDPDAAFAESRRVLKPNGLLTFATLGPDTLRELRSAWSRVDSYPHVHRFIDMHDLGDALLRAGFAEPVMDTERLTVTYRSIDALLGELGGSGSCNIACGRRPGLTARAAAVVWREAYESMRCDGALPVSVEVVYGHAWVASESRSRNTTHHEVRIPLARLAGRR